MERYKRRQAKKYAEYRALRDTLSSSEVQGFQMNGHIDFNRQPGDFAIELAKVGAAARRYASMAAYGNDIVDPKINNGSFRAGK